MVVQITHPWQIERRAEQTIRELSRRMTSGTDTIAVPGRRLNERPAIPSRTRLELRRR